MSDSSKSSPSEIGIEGIKQVGKILHKIVDHLHDQPMLLFGLASMILAFVVFIATGFGPSIPELTWFPIVLLLFGLVLTIPDYFRPSRAKDTTPPNGIESSKSTDMAENALNSPNQVKKLSTLRNVAKQKNLIEHMSDTQTVRLSHYPTAVTIIHVKQPDSRDLVDEEPSRNNDNISIFGNGRITPKFSDGIHAIGFTYQQGLDLCIINVELADGHAFNFRGEMAFFPEISFFGFYSPQPITNLYLSLPARNERGLASLQIQHFYFYARDEHSRNFDQITQSIEQP